MKVLVLMTGAPGSGKSTLIKEMGLKQYTLCPDDIRLLFQSPIITTNGTHAISQNNDNKVWRFLFELLEQRMARGELTVIDATHSKKSDFNRYKKLVKKYRYRVYTISTRNVPIEKCIERNLKRDKYKIVPTDVIKKMYARFNTDIGRIPSWIKVVEPNELINFLKWHEEDFSSFKKIVHIGDIHGCLNPLQKAFGNPENIYLDPSVAYIFVGDYIDRGPQNFRTLQYLLQIYDKPNVFMLEGNHELALWYYANNEIENIRSKEFLNNTMKELDKYGIDKKKLRSFYRSLYQMLKYKYYDKHVLVCHGGIPTYNVNVDNVATEQLIKGVGAYKDYPAVAEAWYNNYKDTNKYLINGHRNIQRFDTQVNSHVFNLEGNVERGGYLRVVTLDKNGFSTSGFKNDLVREDIKIKVNMIKNINDVKDFIEFLRSDKDINEKQFGHISSFNFSKKAFFNKRWNDKTITARGLFINTYTNEIIARSYNKFFNIGEQPETEIENLKMEFPVYSFIKYNGFLGLLGYDSESDEFVFTSKSTIHGQYVDWFKQIFYETVDSNTEEDLKRYLKEENASLIFEVIDVKNDPHIIEYQTNKIVLLDVVKREVEFKNLPYKKLYEFGKRFGFFVKEYNNIIYGYEGLINSISDIKDYYKDDIEGAVFVDKNNFMVKAKTRFYNEWKMFRSIKEKMSRSKNTFIIRDASLQSEESILFYQWLKELPRSKLKKDIITLRKEYYDQRTSKNKE